MWSEGAQKQDDSDEEEEDEDEEESDESEEEAGAQGGDVSRRSPQAGEEGAQGGGHCKGEEGGRPGWRHALRLRRGGGERTTCRQPPTTPRLRVARPRPLLAEVDAAAEGVKALSVSGTPLQARRRVARSSAGKGSGIARCTRPERQDAGQGRPRPPEAHPREA